MSGTSEIGAMYRQLLSARGVPANGDNMRRIVEESRRRPADNPLIPGLTVEGMDQAPPNQSAASMPTQSGVPNSGVALPIPPAPPSPPMNFGPEHHQGIPGLPPVTAPVSPPTSPLPVVDNVHPGATSPGGVIPGTGVTPGSMPTVGPQAATPSSPMSTPTSPMSAPSMSAPSSPMSMSLPHMSVTGSLPGLPQPSPAGGGMDSSDIAQLILGLGAAGGAGVLGPWASAMHGPSGGGAEYMGNAGHAPFTINPDRQAPATRPASEPTARSPSGAPDSGVGVGQSGNVAADIERPGGPPASRRIGRTPTLRGLRLR
jgi:hypothetical protein